MLNRAMPVITDIWLEVSMYCDNVFNLRFVANFCLSVYNWSFRDHCFPSKNKEYIMNTLEKTNSGHKVINWCPQINQMPKRHILNTTGLAV
jgi:hypothetical protein